MNFDDLANLVNCSIFCDKSYYFKLTNINQNSDFTGSVHAIRLMKGIASFQHEVFANL